MASPVNDAYQGASGRTMAGGRHGYPPWVAALPLWQWYDIPNTALSALDANLIGSGKPSPTPYGSSGPSSKINAWCGSALKRSGSQLLIGAAGGHADYSGNEVDSLILNTATPAWSQLRAPSANADVLNDAQFYLDNRPAASHTYWHQQFLEAKNKLIVVTGGRIFSMVGPATADPSYTYYSNDPRTPAFDLGANDWDAPSSLASFPGTGDKTAALCCKHPVTEDIYYSRGAPWWKYSASLDTWTQLSSAGRSGWYAGSAIDPTRNRMLIVGSYDATAAPEVRNLDGSTVSASFSGSSLTVGGYPGVGYDETNDTFVVAYISGGNIVLLRVNASTWVVDDPSPTGTLPTAKTNGICGAWHYVPELKGFVIANSYTGNVQFIRTAL